MEATISFRDVRVGFEEGDIVRGLSFEVFPKETLVLLGETGTGKTLSLKMAAGLLRPLEGEITVLSKQVSRMKEKELLDFRREIGFVFQEGALFDSMTVEENVAYRLREERVPEEEIEPKVREALRFVELEEAIDQVPSELSGGMRRRVSIARALITRPPIVLYDYHADFAAARYLWCDCAVGHAPAAGRIRSRELPFRYSDEPSSSKC